MTEAKKYADVIHFDALLKIKQAFEEFNSALSDAGSGSYRDLEVTEAVVTYDIHKYARVFYLDGEVLVEPLFDLVRDINDR